MPSVIDPETLYVDDLPGIWSPVQWDLSEEERIEELHHQAQASLLWSINVPEAILRMLLNETDIERAFEQPPGYEVETQGEWDPNLVTYQFKRQMRLEKVERESDSLYIEYDFGDRGHWAFEITPEGMTMQRI